MFSSVRAIDEKGAVREDKSLVSHLYLGSFAMPVVIQSAATT